MSSGFVEMEFHTHCAKSQHLQCHIRIKIFNSPTTIELPLIFKSLYFELWPFWRVCNLSKVKIHNGVNCSLIKSVPFSNTKNFFLHTELQILGPPPPSPLTPPSLPPHSPLTPPSLPPHSPLPPTATPTGRPLETMVM